MGRGGRKKKTRCVVPSAVACLICYCHTDVSNSSVVQFYGFILDPTAEPCSCDGDGDGLTPLSPSFRLDGFVLNNVQFCIANSILYMFDEFDYFSVDITKSSRRISIKGYGFLSDSRFMISTDIHGFDQKFALDLDGSSCWEEHFRYPHTPSSYFLAFGNEIYSISGIVRIQDSHAALLSRFDPPLSRLPDTVMRRFEPEKFYNHTHSICLLGADKELIICIAQAAFVDDERNDRPCILYDVYRSDSDPTRKKKASFRFTADIPGHLVTFLSEGMFRANV